MLRGNHESATCTLVYGFRSECEAKYGTKAGSLVYKAARRAFARLPLAACVAGTALVLHGGLFRAPPSALGGVGGSKRRKRGAGRHRNGGGGIGGSNGNNSNNVVVIGSLDDLRAKGGPDPSGRGSSAVAADVLWSDPAPDDGLEPNDARGVGVLFGPDVTQLFLRNNGLRLLLRSHEGPDARDGRDGMAGVLGGWALDHSGPHGSLYTIFSAPSYPMFQAPGDDPYVNLGAVAVLTAPGFAEPNFVQYAAAPRPERAAPFYALCDVCDSDEDVPVGFGDNGMSDLSSGGSEGGRAVAGGGFSTDDEEEEVEGDEVEMATTTTTTLPLIPPPPLVGGAGGGGGGPGVSSSVLLPSPPPLRTTPLRPSNANGSVSII